MPPQICVSKIVQKVERKSSYKLQREFPLLRIKNFGDKGCGARGYFACGAGNVTDEMIKSYIDNHIEGDDAFHIEE